jgi:eukaryotic-like serine/threonine-protein kinase
MAQPNKTKIPVGAVLAGKYRITREIGRGGMAAVYEAENVDIGKRVAIKVLAQELTTSAIVVERFLREARAAAAIRSPYICDVYDSGRLEEDGRPFLVLELLEGDSLYERMTKIRFIDPETTLSIITQTCRGLTKAHAASIVHRDLKPENIFLTKDEEGQLLSKILDFGLAKFYAPMAGTAKQARLTREGAVFGTPAYMSPEQVRGQGAVDHRADLWALGCIVYECLTGRTVWSTDQGVAMTFAQIASAPLPRPAQFRPDLPESFTTWFDRALDRDINKRFQTAKEFSDGLAEAFQRGGRTSLAGVISAPAPSNPFLGSSAPRGSADAFAAAAGAPHIDHEGMEPTQRIPSTAVSKLLAAARAEPPPEPPQASGPAPSGPAPSGPAPSGPAPEPSSPRGSPEGFAAQRPPEPLGPASVDALPPARSRSLGRFALIGGGVLVAGALGYLGWTQLSEPTKGPTVPGSASASTSATPPVPSDSASARPVVASAPLLPWMHGVQDAQQAIASGDLKGAAKLLKEAFDKGGHGVPRTMLDHVGAAMAGASDPKALCRLTGLARPRSYDLASAQTKQVAAGRPDIVVGAHGAVMTWTDAHEGAEHAYAVPLDDALRDVADPVDVTPEATQASHPELGRSGDKLLLSYWDARGPEAGVHARLLDDGGHIAGGLVSVSASPRVGNLFPTFARAPDGGAYAVWSEEGEGDSEDLFLRRLGPSLEPAGDVLRVTDLVPAGPSKPRARYPSLAIDGTSMVLAYGVERDPLRLVYAMHLPVGEGLKGLEPSKKGSKGDRAIVEPVLMNTEKAKADSPSVACGFGACYLVWHGENNGGAWAASVDPSKAALLSHKRFARLGTHPSVAVSSGGQAQVVWYEGGRVLTAAINRDGVGPASRVARISGDQPMPAIAPGTKAGEWYLAWLDYETGHLEAYAARVLCK